MKPMPCYRQLPLTLFRIQPRLPVALRDYDTQMAKGRTSFDLKLHNGSVMPVKEGSAFEGPNGMSLRPRGDKMTSILQGYKGSPRVYSMHEGLTLPGPLVVYHEHTDHYSMQTSEPISLAEFDKLLSDFLASLPSVTKEQYLAQLEDEDDQDN